MNQLTSEKNLNFFLLMALWKFQHFNLVNKISQKLFKPLPWNLANREWWVNDLINLQQLTQVSIVAHRLLVFILFSALASFNRWRKVRIKNKFPVDTDWFPRQWSSDWLQGHGKAWSWPISVSYMLTWMNAAKFDSHVAKGDNFCRQAVTSLVFETF